MKQLCTRIAGTLLLVLLSGCVTETVGGPQVNRAKAIEQSQNLARTYIGQGNWSAAKRHLKNALELGSRSAETYEGLALVFQNTGELEQAEIHYKKALRIARKNSRIRNNYASFLYQEKRYQEAADELERVTADLLYEERANAFMSLGRCYRQLQRLPDAEEALRRAYLLDRNSGETLLEVAAIKFQLKKYGEAQQFYKQFRDRNKTQSAFSLWLGILLAEKYQDRNAISSYGLVLKDRYPDSPEYLQYLQRYSGRGR